tara:strand:+ start:2262 stop:2543 length:282 start_codon:yes stop_codon:yes gene_type:complete
MTTKFERDLKVKIKNSEWFIVTRNGCGYCSEAKKLLKHEGKKPRTKLLNDKNKDKIWKVTDKITRQEYRYFPVIFHKGRFLGGYTELKKKFSR